MQLGASCASCSAKCEARQGLHTTVAEAEVSEPLTEGGSVLLTAKDGALAHISLSLYLFPMTGFLLGAAVAYTQGLSDLLQAASGMVGLFACLIVARLYLRWRYNAGTPLRALHISDS